MAKDTPKRVCVVACGALANELGAIKKRHGLDHVTIECLPAVLHNRPESLPDAVRRKVVDAKSRFDEVLVGYADCGTGGLLDTVCAAEGVERLAGAHCYEFFAGSTRFAELAEAEPGTFYLTDFLATNFERLVWNTMGLDRYPELYEMIFGNYRKVVMLTQTGAPSAIDAAHRAARLMRLPLDVVEVGYGELETSVVQVALEQTAGTVR